MTDEELTKDIDHDFFDESDDNSESLHNNPIIINSNNNNINFDDTDYKSDKKEFRRSLSNVSVSSAKDIETNSAKDMEENSTKDGYSSSASKSSSPSNIEVKSSKSSSLKSSLKSSTKSRSSSSSSEKSNITNVSSIEEESEIITATENYSSIENNKGNRKKIRNKRHRSSASDNKTNQQDEDLISPEIILQAMLKIHESRRAARKLKPPWIDPNRKDYSTGGLTNKLNLLPQYIVSMQPPWQNTTSVSNNAGMNRKNMRINPFFVKTRETQRIKMYHTAINRTKELERIERENHRIYSRLQNIRPSPGITRNEMLSDYSQYSRFRGTPTNAMNNSSSRCHSRSTNNARRHSPFRSTSSANSGLHRPQTAMSHTSTQVSRHNPSPMDNVPPNCSSSSKTRSYSSFSTSNKSSGSRASRKNRQAMTNN